MARVESRTVRLGIGIYSAKVAPQPLTKPSLGERIALRIIMVQKKEATLFNKLPPILGGLFGWIDLNWQLLYRCIAKKNALHLEGVF